MRSWTPRPPSEKLEYRLFPAVAREGTPPITSVLPVFRPLVSALACALFVMAALSERDGRIPHLSASEGRELLESLTNQSISTYLAAGFHSRQNGLRSEFFGWTRRSQIPAESGSFSAVITNRLIH